MAKIQDVMLGKTMRKSFAKHDKILAIPNMLKIQKDSYNWFLDEDCARSSAMSTPSPTTRAISS